MKTSMRIAVVMMAVVLSAAAAGAPAGGPAAGGHAQGDAPGAILPDKAPWAPGMLIIIGVLFVGAAFAGPIYRMLMPEEPQVEDFHSHDEPPGTSHHHGASGTIDHSAPDKPGHH